MPQAVLDIQGKQHKWGITTPLPMKTIELMREDGVDVGILENSIPEWVVDLGLLYPWCFFQDLWNFKNPFRK